MLTSMPGAAWCIHSPTRTWPLSWLLSWPLSWPPSGPAQSVCTNHHKFLRNGNSAICFQPTTDLHPQGLLLRPPGVTDSSAGPNRRLMMAGLPSRTRHVLLPSCEPSPARTPGTEVSAEAPTHPDRRRDPPRRPPQDAAGPLVSPSLQEDGSRTWQVGVTRGEAGGGGPGSLQAGS